MKYATHDNGLIRDEQGNLVGVNLGWDFTAEHEWGVRGIKQDLGVDGKGYGPDRHRIRDVRSIRTEECVVKGTGKGKNKTPDETWYVISCYKHGESTRFLPGYHRANCGVRSAWS